MSGKPPVIGMSLRPRAAEGPRAGSLFQYRVYVDALESAGAVVLPFVLGLDDDRLRTLYDLCDGICLPGGPDVEPRRYGEEPDPRCEVQAAPELDDTEFRLAAWCTQDDRPLLALCRGLQVLNVTRGGTLWQDLAVQRSPVDDHDGHDRPRDALLHTVRIDPGSRLAEIAATTDAGVTSLHHQGIRDLGRDLVATAWSPDGLVEAFEDPSRRFCLGVQFHPEEMLDTVPWSRRLFAAAVDAARG